MGACGGKKRRGRAPRQSVERRNAGSRGGCRLVEPFHCSQPVPRKQASAPHEPDQQGRRPGRCGWARPVPESARHRPRLPSPAPLAAPLLQAAAAARRRPQQAHPSAASARQKLSSSWQRQQAALTCGAMARMRLEAPAAGSRPTWGAERLAVSCAHTLPALESCHSTEVSMCALCG